MFAFFGRPVFLVVDLDGIYLELMLLRLESFFSMFAVTFMSSVMYVLLTTFSNVPNNRSGYGTHCTNMR